jgi:hypothetical protein
MKPNISEALGWMLGFYRSTQLHYLSPLTSIPYSLFPIPNHQKIHDIANI